MKACPASGIEPAHGLFGVERELRPHPPVWLVVAAFGAVYLIWGSTYLGMRVAIDSIPPLLMAGARALCAGSLLYVWMRATGAPPPTPRQWRNAAIVGSLLLFAGNGGVTYAEMTVPSNVTALMIAAVPLWMNLIDWLRPGGRRPDMGVFAGLALGFGGVALIVLGRDSQGRGVVPAAGAAILVFAAFCWALGSIYSRHAERTSSPLLNVAMQLIGGGSIMLLGSGALGEFGRFHPERVTAASAWAFVYLTLVGSLVGFTAYVWLLQVSTPAKVSTYAYVNPLVAVFLGRAVLNETLPAGVLFDGGLILGAVVLITVTKSRRR